MVISKHLNIGLRSAYHQAQDRPSRQKIVETAVLTQWACHSTMTELKADSEPDACTLTSELTYLQSQKEDPQ